MNKRGMLVVLSGPSGVGKGTVLNRLLERNPDLKLSVSATTRPPRPGEQDKVHYYFISPQEFDEQVRRGGMLEYACYNGNCYGTPRQMVERELDAGKDVILEIEVQGALSVKNTCPQAVMIFILPPSLGELESRLVSRGTESPEVVAGRLETARRELAQAHRYDYAVINDTVEEAAARIEEILRAARHSVIYMKEIIDEVQKTW